MKLVSGFSITVFKEPQCDVGVAAVRCELRGVCGKGLVGGKEGRLLTPSSWWRLRSRASGVGRVCGQVCHAQPSLPCRVCASHSNSITDLLIATA